MRKRIKYLKHIPLGCDVSFCELDLTGVVSKATMSHYKGELKERRAQMLRRQSNSNDLSKKPPSAASSPLLFATAAESPSEFVFGSSFGSQTIEELQEVVDIVPTVTGSTSPGYSYAHINSFARIASHSNSRSKQTWARKPTTSYDDEEHVGNMGWTLDLEQSLSNDAPIQFGKGKKKGKRLLVSNSGSRARQT